MIFLILLISFIFGVLRFVLPSSGKINKKDIFKDLAHIWVGILFCFSFYNPSVWFLFVGLTTLEVVAFLVKKKPTTSLKVGDNVLLKAELEQIYDISYGIKTTSCNGDVRLYVIKEMVEKADD